MSGAWLSAITIASVTAFGQKRGCGGFGKLLSAAYAYNAELAGVRCANSGYRCAVTGANFGFPLIPFFSFGSTLFRELRATISKPHQDHASQEQPRPSISGAKLLAKEYGDCKVRVERGASRERESSYNSNGT